MRHRYHTPMTQSKNKKLSYEDAGVSIEQGNELINRIKKTTSSTHRPGVMGGLGGFGALFDIASLNYKHPILVSGTDGVGTKIKLAIENNRHDAIGIDFDYKRCFLINIFVFYAFTISVISSL